VSAFNGGFRLMLRVGEAMDTRLFLSMLVVCGLGSLIVPLSGEAAEGPLQLQGAGATFPAPLYKKWIEVYTKQNPGTAIDYAVVGSGEGTVRFLAHAVDFGASDAALTDEQIESVKGGAKLIPATAGMIVLAYNLPGLAGPLKLSRDVYTDIFAGRIREWHDPRLLALNPGINLPRQSITLVGRLDSSGTTYALSNHLSAISADWRDRGPGVGKVIDWPGHAMMARGNEGVASRIKISQGSIGYVEYGFAKRLGLAMAYLQNRAGQFVEPTPRSGQAALAAGVMQIPADLRAFLPDPLGDASYPIVTFTWLLLYGQYAERERGAALKRFVEWSLTQGQTYSSELGYIPLPGDVAFLAREALVR
jgi:phosphate transport system substrate-binding protein